MQIVITELDSYAVEELIAALKLADDQYFNDEESFLEDSEYDVVKRYAQQLDPSNEYFGRIGSVVRGGKVNLPTPMGSLDQVYTGDTAKWVAKYTLTDDQFVVSDKLDGNSALVVYGRNGKLQAAYSRGDGYQGADITRHILKMPGVPKEINTYGEVVMVRAENIISPANFKRINTGKFSRGGRIYKNPRNMVAGQMNASEVHQEILNIIDTVAYEVVGSTMAKSDQFVFLADAGFKIAAHTIVAAANLNDIFLADLLNIRRRVTEYEIDGIVIDVNSSTTRARIATTDLNPTYSVKFKIADINNNVITTVTHVEYNISKGGYCKPTVHIEPVNLVGVTIRKCTGFNAGFIRDNHIGPGAKVRIQRMGDVIPNIIEVIHPAAGGGQMPEVAGHWSPSGVDFIIDDAHENETVAFEQLKEFFAALEVDYLGEGNLKPMFEAGFRTPEMIIPLTQEDFGSLLGSLAIGKKIFAGMRKAFTNVPIYKLMGAHPSTGRGVGSRKVKKLYEAWNGDMSQCSNIDAIVAVPGFDKKTATKIVGGIDEFNKFLKAIEPHITLSKFEAKKEGHLSGKVFVFTGFRSAELEQKIVDAGGSIGSGVSSKTSYLVTAEPNSTSGKAKKARDAGIAVIGQEELKAMI